MKRLELLIPPVILVVCFLCFMFLVRHIARFTLFDVNHVIASALVIMAGGLVISGVLTFKQKKTTVNPMSPKNSSTLVDTGVYRITRNPMYLGMLLFLIGFGIYLSSLVAIFVALSFIPYMTRFQIMPEEKVLEELFGEEYLAYTNRVRRWL